MRWSPGGTSRNIEDRRGSGGFGGGMAPMGIGGTIVLLVLSLIFGRDFVGGGSSDPSTSQTASGDVSPPASQSAEEAREVQLVSFVLDSAQAVWARLEPKTLGAPWHDAKLVLFREGTPTGCGMGQTAMGPFYCPNDEKVYVDLSFFDDLASRFGAPGEFAQAYVIAHELGHHVQHLVGLDQQVARARRTGQGNEMSVRLELQADCFAGVFGHEMQNENILDPKDIDDGLRAAASVGDDRLQKQATGRVTPESFTHGSSAQRANWFRRGFDTGDPKACDTFGQ